MPVVIWLELLKSSFALSGLKYESLFEVIQGVILSKKTDFSSLMENASAGVGVSAGNGYSYSLDQGAGYSGQQANVRFFREGMEISSLPVQDYVALMRIAADTYSNFFLEEREQVLASVRKLEERYAANLPA
jgi:hypothetical protein